MSEYRVSIRYARALLELGERTNSLELIARDLKKIQEIVRASRDLRLFLKSPVIRAEKKNEILASLFGTTLSSQMFNFLSLLTEKGREGLILDIIDRFFELKDEQEGIENAFVRVAVPLMKQEEAALQQSLQAWCGKKIRLHVSIDPAIIGGFIAQVGDTMLNGSVKHQLQLLREHLASGQG
ncbi:MAG: ATP synthase F1 subunit delta [Bacteroidota bacterium]